MYERFIDMLTNYGDLAAYLLVKCETKTLTEEDVQWAKNDEMSSSTLISMLGGAPEENPDVEFLAREGVNAIAFDLHLNTQNYLRELGLIPPTSVWGEDEMECKADDSED
jgi:hypothetical protein